jgi:hypothetical protein
MSEAARNSTTIISASYEPRHLALGVGNRIAWEARKCVFDKTAPKAPCSHRRPPVAFGSTDSLKVAETSNF